MGNASRRVLGNAHRMVAFYGRRLAKIFAGRSSALRARARNSVDRQAMIDGFLQGLQQPEYVHVLLNPLPVYGLLISWIGLIAAVFLKSRRAQVATLVLVLVSSLSAWPVYEFGQQAYDRVLSMTDDDGESWLDEHRDRGEDLIWGFYALAVLSAAAIAAPIKWPKSSAPL